MQEYLDLVKLVLEKGKPKADRTGVGTLSYFGAQARYNLSDRNFPLVTTRKINFDAAVHEVLWFLKGDTNKNYLNERGVHLWDSWADEKGNLGRIYGAQWNDWRTADGRSINQIDNVIEQIKTNPNSRRHIVTAWNPGETEKMSIPNCCCLFQFYACENDFSCHLYQRSADLFLGVPLNIAQYSLLTHIVAQVTGMQAKELIQSFGDLHLYNNHIQQAKLQITRKPMNTPKIIINPEIKNVKDFTFEDFQLKGYNYYPPIKAEVAV